MERDDSSKEESPWVFFWVNFEKQIEKEKEKDSGSEDNVWRKINIYARIMDGFLSSQFLEL